MESGKSGKTHLVVGVYIYIYYTLCMGIFTLFMGYSWDVYGIVMGCSWNISWQITIIHVHLNLAAIGG